MDVTQEFKSLAALIGDPVRVIMLWNLLDGKAFTATELAISADVSAQSASMHLNKLVQANLLAVESQGRHRYYRFSRPEVAYVIEAMANLLPQNKPNAKNDGRAEQGNSIKYCRTCYDHLAGKVGVAITEQLLKQKLITINGKQYDVTAKGVKWFNEFGVAIGELKNERRAFTRQCLDWSERRHHLAGSLGAALLDRMLKQGWLRRMKNSRGMLITEKGQKEFYTVLQLSV